MDQENKKKRLLLGGYFSSMKDQDAKRRYLDKLRVIGGVDPYETIDNRGGGGIGNARSRVQ